jgi:hypothetical protein
MLSLKFYNLWHNEVTKTDCVFISSEYLHICYSDESPIARVQDRMKKQ